MDFYGSELAGEFLEEFITFLREKSRTPAKINSRYPVGDEFRRKLAMDEAKVTRLVGTTTLQKVLELRTDKGGVTHNELHGILQSISERSVPSEGWTEKIPGLEEEFGPVMTAATFDPIDIMREKHEIRECFAQCMVLQQDRVEEYIAEKYPAPDYTEKEYAGPAAMDSAYSFLSLSDTFAKRPLKGPRDVFALARIEYEKSRFEHAMGLLHPEMGSAELGLKCQADLKRAAEHWKLPLPPGLEF